ncbi:MAG: ABC transporter permease [Thalassobius sp.]|nr:ABC transporter permease [Thalassovita sp.]
MKKDFSFFVAGRLRQIKGNNFSSLIAKIAIGSIAIGIAVMILAFAIFAGFKNNIQEKIFSFASHIQAKKWVDSYSYEELPVSKDLYLYQNAYKIKGVEHIQVYGRKACILKTDEEVSGAVMKGIGEDFDTTRFVNNLVEGSFIDLSKDGYSTDIIISRKIANRLELALHDKLVVYFVQDPPRLRKMTVKGIYETGIEDFDDLVVLSDIRLIQKLNGWDSTQVGGFEIFIDDFTKLDETFDNVWDAMDPELGISKVTELYMQFFDWFIMLNRNVIVVLIVILFVAGFNVISVTLIMITERTNMIGTLKALGSTNGQIRKIFIYNGSRLIIKGLLIGNLLAIGFGYLQNKFKMIPLDPNNYYMDSVPVLFDWSVILLINLGFIFLVGLILMIPTYIIARFEPIKAIKFS